ncbi:Gp37-like protein [Nocardia sp. IFM 10818]
MTSTIVDLNKVYTRARAKHRRWERERIQRPLIRIWDGDMRLYGEVVGELSHTFEFIENDAGTAAIRLPIAHYIAVWIANHKGRQKRNVMVTFDKQGARWSGSMVRFNVVKEKDGTRYLEATFIHDFAHLSHIRVFSNPWLPPEVQFPKAWLLAGPSLWVVSFTIFAQIMRKEMSLWQISDDPLNPKTWLNLDMANWTMAVAPLPYAIDTSVWTIVYSRFGSLFDAIKKTLEDGQIHIDARRYLDGDPPPWPGARLKHGCLVFSVQDKSAWNTGTAFEGNLIDGFTHMFTHFDDQGLVEGQDILPNPNTPDEYYKPDFRGTVAKAPWVIFEESTYTGIESSNWEYTEATEVQVVAGGHSAPYVNEGISAAIIGVAGFLGSLLGAQSQLGPAVDAVLKPLYEDVFAAFQANKDVKRAQDLGFTHFYEGWAEGSDKAYTLGSVVAMRKHFWDTRRKIAVTVKLADAMPYRLGAPGYGDCWLGDRVGVSVLGMPKHLIYVERINRISWSFDKDGPSGWEFDVGQREASDPLLSLYENVRTLGSGLQALGVV